MTDQNNSVQDSVSTSASALSASSQPLGSNVIRPRNRRPDGAPRSDETTSRNPRSGSRTEVLCNDTSHSRGVSWSSEHQRPRDPKNISDGREFTQFLSDSWAQSWTSVQAFASSIISNGTKALNGPESPRERVRQPRKNSRVDAWGPVPPSQPLVTHNIAAGSPAHMQAALKTARTASVLESYEGVNGGLDISGKHKRRKSEESMPHDLEQAEQLVYVHEVQPEDTYAGVVLRYKCREDIFRKSNRLWSQDSVQTRKWLILPVDACEVKGRPLDPQSWHRSCETNLLDSTKLTTNDSSSDEIISNDFLTELGKSAPNVSTKCEQDSGDEKPWTHVRWVQIDSFAKPVQIARVARHTLGYFPPRRKRSVQNMSSTTSLRRSSDLSNLTLSLKESPSPCRLSSSIVPPSVSGTLLSSQNRVDNETSDNRPSWMRRPGGVGSMNMSVKEPGPDEDYLNAWAKKHLPGLDLDTMPSMSVMGSDSACFGFRQGSATIVEYPGEAGRDLGNPSRLGSGLDKAAAAVEHWLRGALAKRPSTPFSGNRSRPTGLSGRQDLSDLIELTNAASDEDTPTNLLTS
ncbi:hypothetical protein E4U41_005733 [Claviceps citrina]|nr:hypothetical protein E4U41_005733 [Claviceps citrina]